MKARGQTLVIFALFLLVLLGISALAVDYANWLLTDRQLQNVSDHASLAGASVFNANVDNQTCSASPGQQRCIDARAQAWTSIGQDLNLTLPVACLAGANTTVGGWTNASDAGCAAAAFGGHRIWVSTPPPSNASYLSIPNGSSGRLAGNYGIVFVRVDRPTRTFFAGVFGISARDRIGWSTAGVLPNDFALEIFCRDGTNPAGGNSVCTSKGVGIEGGGGITLIRGDIGSNESLQVTQQVSSGVVLKSGNVFLVNGACGPSTWNCPPAIAGGISDGNGNPKNAFYIPPQTVPHFQSPLDYATLTNCPTQAQWEDPVTGHVPCVPYRPSGATSPGDWSCSLSDSSNYCGTPVLGLDAFNNRTARCDARTTGPADPHMRPNGDLGASAFRGSQFTPQDIYKNINDAAMDPIGTLNSDLSPTTLTNAPTNWVYSSDGDSSSYRTSLTPPNGIPDPGDMTVRYVLFRTLNGARDTGTTGNSVTVTVQLQEFVNGSWVNRGPADTHDATSTTIGYQYTVNASLISNFSALSLKVSVVTVKNNGPAASSNRGAGLSWAELQTTTLQPALPPMIPPGYYKSITIPDGGCAILDPTGWRAGLVPYQLAGIYRFGGGSNATISLGTNSLLIGDGVTLVFDGDFPDPTGGRGISMASGSAMMINTFVVGGYDTSQPMPMLPANALAGAWGIDPTTTAGVYPGQSMWGASGTGIHDRRGVCTNTAVPATTCISRNSYSPITTPYTFRGFAFYFTNNWPATQIRDRFQMSGATGSEPGIAFKGLLYAPYDDVKLTGGNGFNQIGQVLSWTVKFAGQSTIFLDYPYTRCEQTNSCLPYLLEPTINQ